ncbi:MAG: transcriptional regulator [Pseudoalteromonas sp.]|uniref:nuclear transport factor 2 family protein n=1 Tax=Pseudoalteromonas TaxID=53246 RepID=UPI000C93F78F|nr:MULTISPECIES: nuclear transport factor 2 family protein [unclassified Pseudoalteromonas]MAD03634.1 transcriptional regulator [Pseudoalteromonas sp.]MCP4584804.1 nuclear transport factor 2 family protein [Pseudoalteromonas sp.]URQ92520.1 nuclear transport factor 2 family protein [Pseudoalteromonas sp. SCSIO 43101]|tara:strand:+ start:75260 stop:75688 length:429 start_codon:yes stop_codon:yes gene_type:complete
MEKATLDRFINVYQTLNKDNLQLLDDIYHPDIQFADPLHAVNGLEALRDYFKNLYANVISCEFVIENTYSKEENAFIYWTMQYRHPKLKKGQAISVEGHSRLKFNDDKIIEHRDYFDVGAMLYRHIPVLGSAVKFIDKRASA